ncbi:hypothetical protein ABH995_000895 [Bradyrhizobium yuanmingense]
MLCRSEQPDRGAFDLCPIIILETTVPICAAQTEAVLGDERGYRCWRGVSAF